ncbi:MAG: hypothetical protein RL516_1316 [Bacteroidota bacterium]|jgi:uncharacterized membrane protein YgdD (TMEM256/DUF423 family)
MEKQNYYIKWAAVLAAIAVSFGALGAHTLEKLLLPKSLTSWETAVRYQLIHAVVILILALNDRLISEKSIRRILNFFILGVVFFSGSIYLLATQSLTGLSVSFLGPITPIGGVLMISAWILVFLQATKTTKLK